MNDEEIDKEIETEVPEMLPFHAKNDVSKRQGKGAISDEQLYAQEREEPQAANRTSARGSELDRSGEADDVVVDHLKLNIFEPAPVDHEVVEDVG